jgi:hypothetical protein
LDEAKEWLRTTLADGTPRKAGEIQAQAEAEGIKRRTLQLAAKEVVTLERVYGEHGIAAWHWRLK